MMSENRNSEMLEGFKRSLESLNSLRWAVAITTLGILLLDVDQGQGSFLGIPISSRRALVVLPLLLLALLMARQVVILNLVQLVRSADDKEPFRNVVLSYPVAEFMRWRFRSRLGALLLSLWQVLVDIFPGVAAASLWAQLGTFGDFTSIATRVVSAVIILFAVLNWSSLRFDVYRPLAGEPVIGE